MKTIKITKRFSSHRRGHTFVVVLGASMLVSSWIMASVMAIRIKRAKIHDQTDRYQAALGARSGMNLARYYANRLPDWRNQLGNAAEFFRPLGQFELQLSDPNDDDLQDALNDPVEFVATGKSGTARHPLRGWLKPRRNPVEVLQSAIHSGGKLNVDNSIIRSSGKITADDRITAENNSEIYPDAFSMQQPRTKSGSQYFGEVSAEGGWPVEAPVAADVLEYYSTQATGIPLANIWQSDHGRNELQKPFFTSDLNWTGDGCTINLGSFAASITNRATSLSGLSQQVTSKIYPGGKYYLRATLFNPRYVDQSARLHLKIQTSEELVYVSSEQLALPARQFSTVDAVISPEVSGFYESVSFLISVEHDELDETNPPSDFVVLYPRLHDISYQDNVYVMRHNLLSAENNPFGNEQNINGVYVVDCNDEELTLHDLRLDGSLVLLNADKVKLQGAVHLESKARNYPALVVEGDLEMDVDDPVLSEQRSRVNFNPGSTPFGFASDDDRSDDYSSRIRSLVYVDGKLEINSDLVVDGSLVATDDLSISDSEVQVTAKPVYTSLPPPGFEGIPEFELVHGSYRQLID